MHLSIVETSVEVAERILRSLVRVLLYPCCLNPAGLASELAFKWARLPDVPPGGKLVSLFSSINHTSH